MTKSDKMGMKFYFIFLLRKFIKDIKTLKKQNISEHQSKFKNALFLISKKETQQSSKFEDPGDSS